MFCRHWTIKHSYYQNYNRVRNAHERIHNLFTLDETREKEKTYIWHWYIKRDTMKFSDDQIEKNFRNIRQDDQARSDTTDSHYKS